MKKRIFIPCPVTKRNLNRHVMTIDATALQQNNIIIFAMAKPTPQSRRFLQPTLT